ncbi:hypothetical protein ACFQ38_08275 [Sporosarcina contaminans]|uniref:ABC transporter permease n=1 Tax=Sporosarcina contaminans TaxID=633403 RepID=A0ABW3TXG5_9BACL
MTTYRGLLSKEWQLMKWSFVGYLLTNLVISVFSLAPSVVGSVGNIRLEMSSLVNMWLILHMFFFTALFLQSLHKDIEQPDIWFHSPASIWELLGVKVVMAFVLNSSSLLICLLSAGVAYVTGASEVKLNLFGLPGATHIFITFFMSSCLIMSFSLFIWVIYKITAYKISHLAILVVMPLIFAGSVVWGILSAINDTKSILFSSFMYITISIVLFAGGATLLEKKVRY